ncbi:hypothetical protein SAMN02910456_00990 [Ruminococcaceae bacterium YRB3002]|nr:hypothetical protein SAMN02910456_00990 [Ruminococcaceae bacterium YRB3002]
MFEPRYYELKMSYLKDRISRIPHGKVTTYRGCPVVIIDYDPFDPKVSSHNRKRYNIDSRRGAMYLAVVKEYNALTRELEQLQYQWNSLFRMPPRDIKYPLKKRRYSMFDSSFYEKAVPNSNPLPIEHPIKHKDMFLRSKNELAGCIKLDEMGYEYKVDVQVVIDERIKICPDILIHDPCQCKCISTEIDGAMDLTRYAFKATSRRMTYYSLNLQQGKDIVFYEIADAHEFDDALFESLIRSALSANLDDIIFPDGFY